MKPGLVLQGKYRLLAPLGEGGMGTVWRAENLGLGGALVAVKLLYPHVAANPQVRVRFDQEAKLAASLRSPHVVQVFDFGIDAETQAPFIVMELLEGESLRTRLDRMGRLSPADVARMISDVARALTRAHEMGVVHRDLKPANIFLVRNDDAEVAKVLDFGIAKSLSQAALRGPTKAGVLLGTPHYMSPEQIRDSKNVDVRSDLWSLAIIAVEAMTGRVPFDSENLPGLALQICEGRFSAPSQLGAVPPGFDAWFARATAREPTARFQSPAELAAELRTLCNAPGQGSSIGQQPAGADAQPSQYSTPRTPKVEARRVPGSQGEWGAANSSSVIPTSTSSVPTGGALGPSPSAPTQWLGWVGVAAVLLVGVGVAWYRLGQPSSRHAAVELSSPPPLPATPAAANNSVSLPLLEGDVAQPPAESAPEPVLAKPAADVVPSSAPRPVQHSAKHRPSALTSKSEAASTAPQHRHQPGAGAAEDVAEDVATLEPGRNGAVASERRGAEVELPALVNVNSSERATVYIDGQKVGTTPLSGHRLPPGPHRMLVRADDGRTKRYSLVLDAGKTETANITWGP